MNYLKKMLLVIITITSLNTLASEPKTSDECIEVYQRGTQSLIEASRDFNARTITPGMFSTKVTLIRAKVGAIGLYCKKTQAPGKVKCIKALEKNYDKLNTHISVLAVLKEEQDEVSFDIIDAAEGLLNHGQAILTCIMSPFNS